VVLIKRLILLVVLLLGLIVGIWFSAENAQPLAVMFMGFQLPEWPAGIWMSSVLLLGACLGYAVSLLPALKLKNENLSLRRKLKRRDKEIEKLRKIPLQSSGSSKAAQGKSLGAVSE